MEFLLYSLKRILQGDGILVTFIEKDTARRREKGKARDG